MVVANRPFYGKPKKIVALEAERCELSVSHARSANAAIHIIDVYV